MKYSSPGKTYKKEPLFVKRNRSSLNYDFLQQRIRVSTSNIRYAAMYGILLKISIT